MNAPNFMRAANDGLNSVNDSAADVDVQWSPQQASSLKWIFPQPETAPSQKMTDLTRQQVTDMLAASEAKVDARLANFDTSIKTGFAELATAMAKQSAAMDRQTDALRVEMAQMRTEMAKQTGTLQTEMANTRTDTQKGTTEITRWVVGFGITILGTVLTILGALMTYSKLSDKPAKQDGAQSMAPTIITVPSGSTVLSAPQAPAATAPPPAKQSN